MAYVTHTSVGSDSHVEKSKALWSSLASRYAAYRTYRRTLTELRTLSNRELNDLGLSRSMLKRVAMEAAYDA
ncbi:DUF1127 domain-containing protein [Cognatishimia sp. MH4019]|uniref:DUF1127 domain-containing protein n=1 Tax=Cognatishimia sp. MH4019 TaxID=2854030 RepID=UPI001CD7F252|nr:DUF1127 domain-containing protein [Cognatishimia sp. MH4019]